MQRGHYQKDHASCFASLMTVSVGYSVNGLIRLKEHPQAASKIGGSASCDCEKSQSQSALRHRTVTARLVSESGPSLHKPAVAGQEW